MPQGNNGGPEKLRIGIVHHVRVLREGLITLLQGCPELEATDITEASESVSSHCNRVDIVLLNMAGEVANIAERIQEAKRTCNNAKVVALGISDCSSEKVTCIEFGASAYTTQDSSLEHLIETMQAVHQGKAVSSPDISALVFERLATLKTQLHPESNDRLKRLTPRELEILDLIDDGLSNKEIATRLTLELQTIKNYVHSILEKLRVSNRREAAMYTKKIA